MTNHRPNIISFAGSVTLPILLGVFVPALASAADALESAPPSEALAAEKAGHSAHHGSLFVDPLGFLLFGPTAGVEVGSGHFSGTLYGRWLSAGVLAHSLFLNDGDRFAFSYGAGLRGRYFFGQDLAGPHLGVGVELVHTRVENPGALVATNSTYVVPLIEGGYRLPFAGFYAGASAAFGYAFKASNGVEDLPGGRSAGAYSASNESTVYGSAALELGVYF